MSHLKWNARELLELERRFSPGYDFVERTLGSPQMQADLGKTLDRRALAQASASTVNPDQLMQAAGQGTLLVHQDCEEVAAKLDAEITRLRVRNGQLSGEVQDLRNDRGQLRTERNTAQSQAAWAVSKAEELAGEVRGWRWCVGVAVAIGFLMALVLVLAE